MSVEDILLKVVKLLQKTNSKLVGFKSKIYTSTYYQTKLIENHINFDIESQLHPPK